MSVKTSTPKRSRRAAARSRAPPAAPARPSSLSRRCWSAPRGVQHVAADRHHQPLDPAAARRMVSASSSAWVGCSCAPSPALITRQSTLRDRSSAAPEAWWRTTRMSGLHGVQGHGRVDQGLALGIEDEDDRHVHHIGAQPLAGQFEGGLGAGRGLEEQVDQGAPSQRAALFVDLAPQQSDCSVTQGRTQFTRRHCVHECVDGGS